MLYKYPQAEYPYAHLVQENARRSKQEREFEIIDTGIFDADRYFDVDIAYAKAGAEDILLRLTIHNRGPEEAGIHVLSQIWFRNTWSWFTNSRKPSLERVGDHVAVNHEKLGTYAIQFDGPDEIKFAITRPTPRNSTGAKVGGLIQGWFSRLSHEGRHERGRFPQRHKGGRYLPSLRPVGCQHDHPGQAESGPGHARAIR